MKHKFLAKRFWKDQTTAMGNTEAMLAQFDDVINLSIGDPDLITHELIIEKAFEDAKAGHTRYTERRGYPELHQEIMKFYKEEYDMDVADEELFVSTSACEGMFLVMQAILDEGDEVIVPCPCFTPYFQQIELNKGVPVQLPTYEEEMFQIDSDRLESLITERTKAILINTPNNPTGACLTVETMKKVAAIAEKYDLVVVADEIYTAFSFQNDFVPFSSLPGMKKRTITLNSFSKNFFMTGWRIGYIIADEPIINTIAQINENIVYTAPSISQRAAIHALRHRKEIQPAMVEEYRQRMYYAADRINKIPMLSVINPPMGSFYLFMNIKETGLSSVDAADMLLREAHVLTIPGSGFGRAGEGYVRLALTCGLDKLKEAFDRIEAAMIRYSSK